MSKEAMGPYGVGVWRSTRRKWAGFSKIVRYEMGRGSMVLFWHDLWCGEQPLKFSFPELFIIACIKDTEVVDHMQFRN